MEWGAVTLRRRIGRGAGGWRAEEAAELAEPALRLSRSRRPDKAARPRLALRAHHRLRQARHAARAGGIVVITRSHHLATRRQIEIGRRAGGWRPHRSREQRRGERRWLHLPAERCLRAALHEGWNVKYRHSRPPTMAGCLRSRRPADGEVRRVRRTVDVEA